MPDSGGGQVISPAFMSPGLCHLHHLQKDQLYCAAQGLYHLLKVIFSDEFFCFFCCGMFMSCRWRT
ncbi:hypothetical protein STEG23_004041, partial [Scotinomys teguina]